MIGPWITRRPGLALSIGLGCVVLSLPGLQRLTVQDAWIDNFAPDEPLVSAERAFNEAFWGSYRFDIVVEGEPGLFYGPGGAALVERIGRIAGDGPHVGGVMTYLDTLGEVASALGETRPLTSLSPIRLADIATLAEMGETRAQLRQLLTERGGAPPRDAHEGDAPD